MYWDESKHPRDKQGKFTTADYAAMSIDELKEISIVKPQFIKIPLNFFSEADIKNQASNSLKRAIRKYKANIILHQDKIDNPKKYIPEWDTLDVRKQLGTIKGWRKEIRNYTNSIEERIAELKSRGDYDDE